MIYDNAKKRWDIFYQKGIRKRRGKLLNSMEKLLGSRLILDIRNIVPDHAVCLEAGCGTGRIMERLISDSSISEVIGVDFSSSALQIALIRLDKEKEKINTTGLILADIRRLPFRNEAFDVVISLGVIEHYPNPEDLLTEMRRILKRKGIIFLETPNKGMFGLNSTIIQIKASKYGHHDFYTSYELAGLLKSCGFHIFDNYSLDFSWGVANRFQDIWPVVLKGKSLLLEYFLFLIVRFLTLPLNKLFPTRGYYSVVIAIKQ
jgi:ubiquinone/menaquinone biosynthesis C-methylase UbiE